MSDTIHGSRLCGGARFEVRPPFIRASHCRCSRCRKHSGTAVCTQARVWREQFKLLQGESRIRVCGEGQGVAVGARAYWDHIADTQPRYDGAVDEAL
jgi:hypothetical protein